MRGYADTVAERVREVVGKRLIGVYLVGSAALDDFDPRRSDVDIQAVATEVLPEAERRDLAARLEHGALPNPARGLEFVLYARADLAGPGGPRFQLNLNTGPRMEHRLSLEADADPRFWFTLDVSIARQRSVPLVGPPAAQVLPDLPRPLVAAAALDGLDWFAREAPTNEQTLLGACRSWAWAADGRWRSKGDSARWAMARLADPRPVERALRLRDGEPAAPLTAAEVDGVRAAARAALAAVPPG